MAMREEDVADRKIGGKDYRIQQVPPGQRDDRVSAKIICTLDGWSYEGEPNPKRVDLCIAYHLLQKREINSAQLRWCASIGLGFALKAPEVFGFDADYDTALESVSDVLRSRVKLVTDELVKVADRMVANMARRSKRENGTRIFNWMAPSGSGLFEGVKEAFSSATTVAHQLNPFHRSDDDD
jgi:hypothetical protein